MFSGWVAKEAFMHTHLWGDTQLRLRLRTEHQQTSWNDSSFSELPESSGRRPIGSRRLVWLEETTKEVRRISSCWPQFLRKESMLVCHLPSLSVSLSSCCDFVLTGDPCSNLSVVQQNNTITKH